MKKSSNERFTSTGKLFADASPAIEKEYKDELAKAERQYGGGPGVDMKKFPDLKFGPVKVDSCVSE